MPRKRAKPWRLAIFHMRLELARALRAGARQAAVSVRVAYLDYLLLAPRVQRKDKNSSQETERRFKSLYALAAAGLTAAGTRDKAAELVLEIERGCLPALEDGTDGL